MSGDVVTRAECDRAREHTTSSLEAMLSAVAKLAQGQAASLEAQTRTNQLLERIVGDGSDMRAELASLRSDVATLRVAVAALQAARG